MNKLKQLFLTLTVPASVVLFTALYIAVLYYAHPKGLLHAPRGTIIALVPK